MTLCLAQEDRADELLSRDPFSLLAGMLLDQQVPMERAFAGPRTIADRLGTDSLDPAVVAAQDPEAFAALLSTRPAVHRYPAAMAKRIQALALFVLENHDGDVESVWTGAADGKDLLKRLGALPGFGKQKAQIFAALLGKQLGVRPEGWREATAEYGVLGSTRSIADVVDAQSLAQVREFKQSMKAKAREASS